MESTTIGILIAVVGFALFGAFYVIYGAKRGKAEGKTEPHGASQPATAISMRTPEGEEVAPRDMCPPLADDVRKSA